MPALSVLKQVGTHYLPLADPPLDIKARETDPELGFPPEQRPDYPQTANASHV